MTSGTPGGRGANDGMGSVDPAPRRFPMKPILLDLYCKAGGCAKGYQEAGFEVWGVDIEPQPNYCGDRFFRMDAREALRDHAWGWPLWHMFDAIHASPPCQFRTAYKRRPGHVAESPNLIPETRELLEATGLPYVIENIPGAQDELRDPIQLCGSSFNLDVRRHRLFETNFPLMAPPCAHGRHAPRFPAATNREPTSRRTVEIGVWRIPLEVQQKAMGIDWMTLEELSEAIPPAYTEHIGHYLMASRSLTEPRRSDGHGDRGDAPAREPSNLHDLSKPYRDTYPYGGE